MVASPFAGMPAFRDANTWKVFMGITEDNQSDYIGAASFAHAPADEAWVYSCVRRLYTSAQSVPLRVYSRDGKDLVPVTDSGDADGLEAQFVLDNVNPVDMNGSDLKAYTVAGYAVWGGSYWKKVRGKLRGRPQELYWLRVPDVRVDSPDGRRVDHYEYRPLKGNAEIIDPRDMLVFKTVNLENPLEPLSPLSGARSAIAVNRNAAEWNANVLKNKSIPPGYWQGQKGVEVSPADKGLLQRLFRGLRGPRNAGKTPFIPFEVEYKQLSLNPADADWIKSQKLSRMAVCAALGVPLVLAGDDESTNVYGNIRDARRTFWQDTMIPLLDWYADVLNGWFLPDFDPTRRQIGQTAPGTMGKLVAGFDYTEIEALQEPFSQRVLGMTALADRKALVPNELRATFRLGKPYPDAWANQPVPSTTRVTLTGLAPDTWTNPAPSLQEPAGPEIFDPGRQLLPDPDMVEVVRSTAGFYKRPAVRRFIATGEPLDTEGLFGIPVPDGVRSVIEDGIRARLSAAQIAGQLEMQR